MAPPKVLGLVLSADIGVYTQMITTIYRTWGTWPSEHFKTKFYWGRSLGIEPKPGEVIPHGPHLVCGCVEYVDNILLKTVMTFDYVARHYDFDYIIRTCCGAYVAPWRLLKYLEDKPRTAFYAGRKARLSEKESIWAHGVGYVLSKDLVQLVGSSVDEVCSMGSGRADDQVLGQFLAAKGVQLVDFGFQPAFTHQPAPIPPYGFLHHFSHTNFSEMPAVHADLMRQDGVSG